MVFGVPECDFVPSLGMFRVRKAFGKSFTSGGFGMALSVEKKEEVSQDTANNDDQKEQDALDTLPLNAKEGKEQSKAAAPSAEHLFIEEALVLFERGVLDVYNHNDTKLDAQGLYDMLEELGVSLPIYLTYAHLRAQDYRVLRHVAGSVAQVESSNGRNNSDAYEADETLLQQQQQQIKQARRTVLLQTLDNDPSSIAFDVYQPDTAFRKTYPGPPHFVVAVASFKLQSPTFVELQELQESCNGVPLRIATVSDGGAVVMFGVTHVGVPDISTSNDNDGNSSDTNAS